MRDKKGHCSLEIMTFSLFYGKDWNFCPAPLSLRNGLDFFSNCMTFVFTFLTKMAMDIMIIQDTNCLQIRINRHTA